MSDGTHRIDITVLEANETNPFIVDYIALNRISGGSSSVVGTSHNIPSSTSTSSSLPTATSNLPVATRGATPVGVIVGSVLGGIAGIILVIALGFCLRSRNKPGGFGPITSKSPARRKFPQVKVCTHSVDRVAEDVDCLPELF
jgi:hypothetical protein